MFEAKQFSIPELKGISAKTIEEHLKLYQGYVKHANLILDHINELSKDSEKYSYELGELQRRFGFEWGGMRNHEVYFSLLEDGSNDEAPELKASIAAQWGTFETWLTRFQATALTRGIGWAILYYDPKSKQLLNTWVDEQHLGQLVGCIPLITLDMWEHSYVSDYQPSGKKQYVSDFLENLNWSVAEKFFLEAKK